MAIQIVSFRRNTLREKFSNVRELTQLIRASPTGESRGQKPPLLKTAGDTPRNLDVIMFFETL